MTERITFESVSDPALDTEIGDSAAQKLRDDLDLLSGVCGFDLNAYLSEVGSGLFWFSFEQFQGQRTT